MQERRTAPPLTVERRRVPLRRSAITVVVALAVVGLDQWASTWAVHRLAHGPVHVIGPLTLELGINTGSAFSLAQGWAPILVVVGAVMVVALLAASWRARSDGLAAALGLVVGGATGNLVDRLARPYHGGVVDFIHVPHWPTFNVADACITVGVIAVALFLWHAPETSAPAPGAGAGAGAGDVAGPGAPTGTGPAPPAGAVGSGPGESQGTGTP